MKNDLYEKAKQAVADKHPEYAQFFRWLESMEDIPDIEYFYREVSEWVANEAVKTDRSKTRRMCLTVLPGLTPEMINNLWVFDGLAFENIPLPFPQQPDGI